MIVEFAMGVAYFCDIHFKMVTDNIILGNTQLPRDFIQFLEQCIPIQMLQEESVVLFLI